MKRYRGKFVKETGGYGFLMDAKDNEGNKAEHILTVFCESCETEESQFNVKVNKAVDSVMKKSAPTKQENHVIIASLPVKGIIVHRADFIRISTSSEPNKLLTNSELSEINSKLTAKPDIFFPF